MKYHIDLHALRTILFGTLSCRCPVTEETERALFREYFRLKGQGDEVVGFNPILEIADRNPERTPLHNLFHFCSYAKDDPSCFVITQNDVIRYLGSKYHFDMVDGSLEVMKVSDKESYLASHMLLPVLLDRQEGYTTAIYRKGEHSTRFFHVFFPPEVQWHEAAHYGLHMGTVLGTLSPAQVQMVEAHLALIKDFPPLISHVPSVDLCAFEPSGDHLAQVTTRFRRHYSF